MSDLKNIDHRDPVLMRLDRVLEELTKFSRGKVDLDPIASRLIELYEEWQASYSLMGKPPALTVEFHISATTGNVFTARLGHVSAEAPMLEAALELLAKRVS